MKKTDLKIETKAKDTVAESGQQPTDMPNLTLIRSLGNVLEVAEDSGMEPENLNAAADSLAYLRNRLQMSDIQCIVLALLINSDQPMSWRMMADSLGISRINMMVHTDDIEELVNRGWLKLAVVDGRMGRSFEGFALEYGVIRAIRQNKPFEPIQIEGLELKSCIEILANNIMSHIRSHRPFVASIEASIKRLLEANKQHPLCTRMLELPDDHSRLIALYSVCDYLKCINEEDICTNEDDIENLLGPNGFEVFTINLSLENGEHVLLRENILEEKSQDGVVMKGNYRLTNEFVDTYLKGLTPRFLTCTESNNCKNNSDAIYPTDIAEKQLFYNAEDQRQIEQLTTLLEGDNLDKVQARLKEQGMRQGFACLLYGAPGTGKTETVNQIARHCDRAIYMVDIASIRDKYVGESEKRLKALFNEYRKACRSSKRTPILFFNEADAIFSKRSKNVERAVDKMENSLQNIILQEMETLEGILIATTNLTNNMDSAFERRFIFKVEFHKPEANVRSQIWKSMLPELTDEEVAVLSHYDLAGGNIENVKRKIVVDYILSGNKPNLDQLQAYCDNELIDDPHIRKSVGFAV